MSVRDARGRPLKTLAAWQVAILIKSLPCLMEPGPFGAGVFGEHFFAGRGEENNGSIEAYRIPRQAFILKQGEAGMPGAEICRKAGISQAT